MMSCLRKVCTVTCLLLSLSPAGAVARSDETQLQFFAACAGRLSATIEHKSMFEGSRPEQMVQQHRWVEDLIEALLPEGRGPDALNWQLHAKVAHSGLLSRALMAKDERISREASRLAQLYLTQCTDILTG